MAKRFIDTGLFDDEWFMGLSKDAKILWLYFITKCDHAGIIRLNEKLCRVQTDIKEITTVIEQLGNRLVTVGEHLFFIPKFVEYQYPGFPDCKFNMAKSAISILEKYNLIKNGCLTVPQELPNSYGISNGIGNSNGNGIGIDGDNENLQLKYNAAFDLWLKYKSERKQAYKSDLSRGEAFSHLMKLADNNEETAMLIVKQSIANNWSGLFELRPENKKPETDEQFWADVSKIADKYINEHPK